MSPELQHTEKEKVRLFPGCPVRFLRTMRSRRPACRQVNKNRPLSAEPLFGTKGKHLRVFCEVRRLSRTLHSGGNVSSYTLFRRTPRRHR